MKNPFERRQEQPAQPQRVPVTDEMRAHMSRHRRLLAEAQAQREQPESRPSVPKVPQMRRVSSFAIRTHTKEY